MTDVILKKAFLTTEKYKSRKNTHAIYKLSYWKKMDIIRVISKTNQNKKNFA